MKWLIVAIEDRDLEWTHSRLLLSILRIIAEERKGEWRIGMFYQTDRDGIEWNLMSEIFTLPCVSAVEPDGKGGNIVTEGPTMIA